MTLSSALVAEDASYGPQWAGEFDFTLSFENWFLVTLPAGILLLLTPIYASYYLRRQVKALSGTLLWTKLVAAACLLCIEIVAGILWGVSSDFPLESGIVAIVFSCVAAVCTGVMIALGHWYATQSSMIFSIYLSVAFVFEIARSRSFFLRGNLAAVGALSALGAAMRLAMVILEEVPKPLVKSSTARKEDDLCKEATSGFWNRTMLLWLNPTLLHGFRQNLEMEHLANLGPDFSSETLSNRFEVVWAETDKSSKHCLAKASIRTLLFEFLMPAVPRLAQAAFNFGLPWLMRRVLSFVRHKEQRSAAIGGGLVGASVFIYFGTALARTSYRHMGNRFAVQLRGLLTARILVKNVDLSFSAAKNVAALTLAGIDVEGIIDSIQGFHDVWVALVEIAAALYLLSGEIGKAFFLPILTILLSFGCSYALGSRSIAASAQWNKSIEARVTNMAAFMSQIKVIKMVGLDEVVRNRMRKLRREEIEESRPLRWIRVGIIALLPMEWAFTPAVIFAGGIFWTTFKTGLDPISLFTTLVLVALFSTPLMSLLQYWPLLGTAAACFRRIQEFLLLEEQLDPRQVQTRTYQGSDGSLGDADVCEKTITLSAETKEKHTQLVLEIHGATIAATRDGSPVLDNVNLSVSESNLFMVVGAVGSGKSILLRSLLGETFLLKGSIDIHCRPKFAFCDQKTWLPNMTIREVIIGEEDPDEAWYNTVLNTCLLKHDIEQFEDKDRTKIGSNGARLSGGQKQRVAIARALYLRSPLLVLDDVFSALDRKTASAIFTNLFVENGIIKRDPNITTILATHSIEFLAAADEVAIVENKSLVTESSIETIRRAKTYNIGVHVDDTAAQGVEDQESEKAPLLAEQEQDELAVRRDEMVAERPRHGEFQIYRFFLQAVPKWMIILFTITIAIVAFLERSEEFYLRVWVEVAPKSKTWFVGMIVLGVLGMMFNGGVAWLWLVTVIPMIAWSMHDLFLVSVMDATLTYLTSTNTGVILNRSSQDMSLLSQQLPMAFFRPIYISFFSLTDTVMIVASATYAALVVPFMLAVIYFLQLFYLRTSRQMRYLDLEAKTPLFTKVTETAAGVEYIRAFGWQKQTLKESFRVLDDSQKAVFYMYTIQRWLLFVLDTTILLIATVLVAIAVFWTTTTNESSLGLGLLGTMTWNLVLANWVNYWTNLETSLGAVQRLRSFVKETPQEQDKPGVSQVENWPRNGVICFKKVTAKYDPNGEPKALDDVSFDISAGKSVGITGRTGSGKSSLLLTILRLISYEGSIIIDGVDITEVPYQQLRQSLIVITQEALHLPGTVRENLLPQTLGQAIQTEHDAIKATLEKVKLWSHINAHGGLDVAFDDMEFSQGQRQLFSLARALLQKSLLGSKILLVDEATSSIDYESDTRIQKVLKEAFEDCTRLVIAHRVQTIADSDILIEFSNGQLVSFTERIGE